MDAAERLAPDETEPLPWAQICARYSDQYVCLVDVVHPRRGDPDIVSARVVGTGATDDAAFAARSVISKRNTLGSPSGSRGSPRVR